MTPKSNVALTPEEDSKLIELVSNHPCLFDLENKFYRNILVKENVWQQISDVLKKTVDECKKRWKNIKDTYNKHKRNRKLGTGSSASNKPTKWVLADSLSFLDVVSYERTGLSNIESNKDGNECTSNNSEEEDNTIIDVDDDVQSQKDLSNIDTTVKNIFESNKRTLDTDKMPVKNKKTKQNDDLIEFLKKSSDERKEILNKINNDQEEDPIDAFFKSMALTVKQFSSNFKIKSKKEVFNIITQLEIENNNSDSLTRQNLHRPAVDYTFSSPSSSVQSSQSGFSVYNHSPTFILPEVQDPNVLTDVVQNWNQLGGQIQHQPHFE
ncbi:unnamed protein product [Macrosiphum euphorbiae]|uniref:MADF domain-containing protein n=1 Tax=Macrosiphum euphorbiae TaxID=13131 RepID=A0AAV0WBR9_9HEMI|nr:unnamed protein product [Macrosiphum euphorbiae]